jgi:transposase
VWVWAAKKHVADNSDTALDSAHARRLLAWWYWWISEQPVSELVTLAETISAWEPLFLAYFDTRATNGRTEGVNRIIKHVKRTGFGYRNLANHRLKILYRCTRLPSTTEAAERPPAAGNA